MADSREYYYMRLKEDFFDSNELKLLEGLPDGVSFSNILLKMYLASLKTDGRLMLNDLIPYSPEMISKITGHGVEVVRKALKVFEEYGLIEVLDDGAIYMSEIQNYIGKSSTTADRKRDYRARIEQEKVMIERGEKPNLVKERNEYSETFEEFWKEYPNKKDKGRAYACYKARLADGWSEHELIVACKNYAYVCRKEHTEEKYIKHASTFLSASTPFTDYIPKEKKQENVEDGENPYR